MTTESGAICADCDHIKCICWAIEQGRANQRKAAEILERQEYAKLRKAGYAGMAAELVGPWDAPYWRLTNSERGTVLVPVDFLS